jgi:hypothetical protein
MSDTLTKSDTKTPKMSDTLTKSDTKTPKMSDTLTNLSDTLKVSFFIKSQCFPQNIAFRLI